MGADSSFELWLVLAVVAMFAGMVLSYALVEFPGRFLIMSLVPNYEPTSRFSRAVGLGMWTVIFTIVYFVAT